MHLYYVCYYVFIACIYYMHLFNIFILCIYVLDETGSLEKFQESNTGMKGGFGEEKIPHYCLHFMSLFQFPHTEMQTGPRGGAWTEFQSFSLGNTAASGNPWSCWGLVGSVPGVPTGAFPAEVFQGFGVILCVLVPILGYFPIVCLVPVGEHPLIPLLLPCECLQECRAGV